MDDICGAMIQLDKDGIITSWNESATDILGYNEEDIVSKNAIEMIFINEPIDGNNIMNVIETGEVYYSFDSTAKNSDGSTQPVSLVVSPLSNEDGVVSGVTILVSNILLL